MLFASGLAPYLKLLCKYFFFHRKDFFLQIFLYIILHFFLYYLFSSLKKGLFARKPTPTVNLDLEHQMRHIHTRDLWKMRCSFGGERVSLHTKIIWVKKYHKKLEMYFFFDQHSKGVTLLHCITKDE